MSDADGRERDVEELLAGRRDGENVLPPLHDRCARRPRVFAH